MMESEIKEEADEDEGGLSGGDGAETTIMPDVTVATVIHHEEDGDSLVDELLADDGEE